MNKILRKIKENKALIFRLSIGVGVVLLISFLMYVPSLPYKPPKIEKVLPYNGTTDVIERAPINIYFEKAIPAEERENFYLRLLPGVDGITSWPSPNQLTFAPNLPLEQSTTYKVALSYKGVLISETQFSTRYRKEYTEEELTEIREWSFATSRAMYETFKEYPFLQYMPIETESFNVMFDSTNEQFRYLLKMDENAPEVTKYEAIRAATDALTSVGVDVDEWGYYVKYTSEGYVNRR